VFGLTIVNEIMYSASADETLRSWDISTGKCLQVFNFETIIPNYRVDLRNVIGDTIYLISTTTFDIVTWFLKAGKNGIIFSGHRGDIRALKVENSYLYSASADRTLKKWREKDGTCLFSIKCESPLTCMVLTEENIFVGSEDGRLRCWSLSDLEEKKKGGHVPSSDSNKHQKLTLQQKSELIKELSPQSSVRASRQFPSRERETTPETEYVGYFVGEMSRSKAEALLVSCGFDSFLVRTSSVQGCLALSKYEQSTGKFNHVLISNDGSKYSLQDSIDSVIYRSLNELVEKSPECTNFKAAFDQPDDSYEYQESIL